MPDNSAGARRAGWWIAAETIAVAVLTAALVWPLLRLDYHDNWSSIESTFIADGRFLRNHWPPPRWQPLWYCGTRFDYVYPPALRYGTALGSKLLGVSTARSYHLYVSIFYCLGIAGVYLLVRLGSRSRAAAALAAAGAAILSPFHLFLADIRTDAGGLFGIPQRLHALVGYGEGPHMSAFAVLPFALAAAFYGLRANQRRALGLAALLSALVVANNFYGATALAMTFPVLVWAVWITERDRRVPARAAAIALLAYALTAYWLTPSYIRLTLRNMQLVSEPGNRWSIGVALAAVLVFCALTWWLSRGRPQRAWPSFIAGFAFFMGLNVIGEHFVNFRVIGEPERLIPELDLALVLAGVELLRRLWTWKPARVPRWAPAAASLAIIVFCFLPAKRYLKRAWDLFPPDPHPERRIEYRLTKWLAGFAPDTRVMTSGSFRFWFNAWYDLPELGGGSEQGLLNMTVQHAQVRILWGPDAEPGIAWMKALGVGIVVTHDENSQEIYKDFKYPRKFDGLLPLLYDDGEGNRIYRVPRRYPARVRVVVRQDLQKVPAPAHADDIEPVEAYVKVVEEGPASEAHLERLSPDRMRIRASIQPGQVLLVQESYDPSWRAMSGGRSLPVKPDAMGFFWIDVPPGDHQIEVFFDLPLENFAGRVLTLAGLVVLMGLLIRRPPPKPVSGAD